jgi:triphosphatase
METELKLRFTNPGDEEGFLNSSWLSNMAMPDSQVVTNMLSRYFDTASQTLTQMKTSLRIREEGEERVVTIKLGGQAKNGLHQRLEWSVDLEDEGWTDHPQSGLDTGWFQRNAVSDGDPDDTLRGILLKIDKQPLIEICHAKFVRTAFDVGYGDTLMELALDVGELSAGELTDSILEIELELKEGDVRDLMELGDELQARFALTPEPLSKYARCLALLKQQPDLQDA